MDDAMRKGKRELLERLLEKGMVMVVLDARRPGVAVPPHLVKDPQLRLNLSFRFGFPMELDDWGVKATLTFGGSAFACRLPWNAICAMVSHVAKDEPYLFPDDLPDELRRLAAGQPEDGEAEESADRAALPGEAPVIRRAHLAVVEGGAPPGGEAEMSEADKADQPEVQKPAPASDRPDGDAGSPKPAGRPTLRLIK